MRLRFRALTFAFTSLLVMSAGVSVVSADSRPSPWAAARDPSLRAEYALHVAVREALALERPSLFFPTSGPDALERARALLEDGGAETAKSPELRFDLGEVYASLGHTERAIEVLLEALREFPDVPAALDAYVTLANAYAHLDRAGEEREVYERYLARVTSERSRTMALLNLAEAEMHLGELDAAVARYRDAIGVAANLPNVIELEDNTGTLAVWGLAVALDRAGDASAAREEVSLAVQLDQGLQIVDPARNPSVFFAPSYEVDWYLGLGHEGLARRPLDPKRTVAHWREAEAHWGHYVASAPPSDPWLPGARAHLARAKAWRADAERRAARPAALAPGAHAPRASSPAPPP